MYDQLKEASSVADALALGMRAAHFGGHRTDPVCKEIIDRADEYLSAEAERVRPAIKAGGAQKLEEEAEVQIEALKKEAAGNNPPGIGNAAAEAGSKLLNLLSVYRGQWEKLMEESQFLWWLIGRRSAQLQSQRESLSADFYAFPAAAEAAERVALLPPAPSIESLLEAVVPKVSQPRMAKATFSTSSRKRTPFGHEGQQKRRSCTS